MSGYWPRVEFSSEDRQRMGQIAGTLPTKAAKIRALSAAGYTRQKIAAFLDVRYQHVRNVLTAPPSKGRAGALPLPSGPREGAPNLGSPSGPTAAAASEVPAYGRLTVDERGRIALPAGLLAALDSGAGGVIPWHFENGELKLMNRDAGVRFAQSLVAEVAKRHPTIS